jgi:predicted signal transduction protein with EAL and GGDEF domain
VVLVVVLYSFKFFSKLFDIDLRKPELYRSQYKAMAKQTPFLYMIVITATFALAHINFEQSPFFLTIVFPLCLLVGDVVFFLWFMSVLSTTNFNLYILWLLPL